MRPISWRFRRHRLSRFQSTHPHGVRRGFRCETGHGFRGFNPRTHTGCDLDNNSTPHALICFNPRTHTGCDSAMEIAFALNVFVSIHAPTRGATPKMKPYRRESALFQSTHPHGVRRKSRKRRSTVISRFNPRTHTGCDYPTMRIGGPLSSFQSTHPHGVRRSGKRL